MLVYNVGDILIQLRLPYDLDLDLEGQGHIFSSWLILVVYLTKLTVSIRSNSLQVCMI